MTNPYDIEEAFAAIEEELIESMVRNMIRHKAEEDDEGIQWEMWQVKQLEALEKYKKANRKKFSKEFDYINQKMEELIKEANAQGMMEQELEILQAIKNGYRAKKAPDSMQAEFFKLNERKLEALINATTNDMQKAETAILRMADDKYRQIIYNAQVYANTGAGTYEKAVDMATKDMLTAGLHCVEYANGARHTLKDYADMAIRTASKRAYLQGEGTKRQEWGISTVIVNKRGNPCPKCLPFCGKILIDDVWSGGSRKDGPYPLMSKAITAGLYHPRCKDSHTTYFEGISTPPDDKYTKKEIKQIETDYLVEQKQQYAKRQAEKFGRLEKYSLDERNREFYGRKANMWKRVRFKTGGTELQEYIATKNAVPSARYLDVTDELLKNAIPNSHEIIDLSEYTIDGITYIVDGKHVVMDYRSKEKQIAEILRNKLGGEVAMVPRVLTPKGVSTPDYIFRGEKYDLKELFGESKNLIYNVIAKKKRQSNNFILDITKCPLETDNIYEQAKKIYYSTHTRFVDTLIIIKDDNILKIFSRNKK